MAKGTLDRNGIKQWILRKLGAPILKVELTDAQLDDAIEDAVRWFAAKKGVDKILTISLVSGQSEYPLPSDADEVLDVIATEQQVDFASVFFPTMGLLDGDIPFNLYGSASLGVTSNYVQVLQYLETLKRVLGSEMEWFVENGKLVIVPPPSGGSAVIRYSTSDIKSLKALSERDYDLVRKYSYANALETLGRVRSKYAEYPTAQGSVSLDGERLLEEANTLREKLEEEISDSAYPMGFLTG